MNIADYKDGHVFFIGCGGAGTQPLMKIFHDLGYKVAGSDLERSAATDALERIGLEVHIGHSAANLPQDDRTLVIHTSAAGPGNPEFDEAKRRNLVCVLRGEALGLLANCFKRVVAVSGSHGKTSISAMTSHVLKTCGLEPGYLVGGKVCGWGFNGAAGSGDIFVTEADESDGTHTRISAAIAVVPNVEDDHAWNVGGFDALLANFKRFAFQAKHLIYVASETSDRLFAGHPSGLRLEGAKLSAKGFLKGLPEDWGAYQRLNAALAVEAAALLGVGREKAAEALASYPGVERRMSLRYKGNSFKLIEDYAHHPTELAASLGAMKETNPGRPVVVVFQPHRYARLARYIDLFAEELRGVSKVFVTPVFAAWTSHGSVDSAELVRRIGPTATLLAGSWDAMADSIRKTLKGGELVAIIGAGDLKDLIPPLMERMKSSDPA